MAYDADAVLRIVKTRLNRVIGDTTLDEYLLSRIGAAEEELAEKGIHLVADRVRDTVFLADYVSWQHLNRDQPGSMPEWMKLARRERWLAERNGHDDSG